MTRGNERATDLVLPTIAIDSPTPGSTATNNSVHLQVTASDNQRIWKVEIYKNGDVYSPIYSAISTSGVQAADWWFSSGPHRLLARVWDMEGNQGESTEVSFNVLDSVDTVFPWACFLSPSDSVPVSGPITVSLDAGDNVGVTSVVFYALDIFDPMLTFTNPPYAFPFDSATASDGYHHFRAEIRDASGNFAMAQVMFEILQDGDGDGMPDWWEIRYFGATNAVDGLGDADGDRMRDRDEYTGGTNPTN